MKKGIVGKKIGMTQVFTEDGRLLPVTVIQAGPCPVVQKKTIEKDGYEAIQVGFDAYAENRAEKLVNKPLKGHFAKANVAPCRQLRELRLDDRHLSVLIEDAVPVGFDLFGAAAEADDAEEFRRQSGRELELGYLQRAAQIDAADVDLVELGFAFEDVARRRAVEGFRAERDRPRRGRRSGKRRVLRERADRGND